MATKDIHQKIFRNQKFKTHIQIIISSVISSLCRYTIILKNSVLRIRIVLYGIGINIIWISCSQSDCNPRFGRIMNINGSIYFGGEEFIGKGTVAVSTCAVFPKYIFVIRNPSLPIVYSSLNMMLARLTPFNFAYFSQLISAIYLNL